jgi:hypothetical protein
MGPFNVTVFRVRLLLLAVALGLAGFGGEKKASNMAEAAKPIKVLTENCTSAHRNVSGLLAVHGVDCASKKRIGASS